MFTCAPPSSACCHTLASCRQVAAPQPCLSQALQAFFHQPRSSSLHFLAQDATPSCAFACAMPWARACEGGQPSFLLHHNSHCLLRHEICTPATSPSHLSKRAAALVKLSCPATRRAPVCTHLLEPQELHETEDDGSCWATVRWYYRCAGTT